MSPCVTQIALQKYERKKRIGKIKELEASLIGIIIDMCKRGGC